VLAVALPVFALSARTVTDAWAHPWSHLWILVTLAVALEIRRLLHRHPASSGTEVHWHLYFLVAGGVTAILAVGHEINRSPAGALDPIGVAGIAVVACLVAVKEAKHMRSGAPRGND